MTAVGHYLLNASELTPDLVETWKNFCRGDPLYQSPFYWPQFTQTVAKVRNDVRIAVLEERGEVFGFLPFHLTRSGVGKPIGGQLNDYHGPIIAPGTKIPARTLLTAAEISTYDYNHLPVSFSDLSSEAHSFSMSPQMELAEGYDAFVARKDSSWTKAKREIRRRYRKTEEEFGPIRFTFHDPDDGIYRHHLQMKNALYERAGTKFQIRSDWLGRALEALRSFSDPEFASVMTTLHAGDRLLASHFGLKTSNVWHWWFPAYDLEAYKLGPGINLVDQCAMAAERHGISLIDLGRGDGAFKQLFADRYVDLCEGAITRPGSLAKLIRKGTHSVVSATERLPFGRYKTYPRRAAAKYISGVSLPSKDKSDSDWNVE
jgi:CelD/BcsL family acetyltransferase involved in cellulose biosynthesis